VINQVEQLEMKPAAKTNALSNSPVGKIIVVDDEPELKNILVKALSGQGFEVTGCSSGQQALAELRQKEFDLLLTDLMMPEMDGIALLEAALKVDPHLIGIMMTGQGTIQTAVDAMKAGAFDYVLKPFRLQTLLPVLTRAINTRRLRMENLQLRETVAIYGLCQTISFTLDAQTVLSRLADAALQQSDADEVSILLPTSDGKELFVAAVRGEKRERLLGERVPLQESISSWVARERMPLILNGEVHDERFVALWPRPEIRSAVSVPMQVANKLVGIINLNVTNRLRPFTLGQMKALTILASTAAAALESASLYTQVRTTEEKYRSIFENATEGLFQTTSDGRLLTANPTLARILGYDSPEEMIATITDIAHQLYVNPEDRAEAGRLQEECGTLEGFELEAYRKDGEKIWLRVNRRSVRNQNGEVLYFEGSVEDITARRHIEEEKRKTRQQYESLVHTIDGIVWELDVRTFNFTFVSKQTERLLGYTPEQWLSDPGFWKDHLHPDDRSWAIAFCRDATARREDHEFDYRMIAADGRVVWLRDIVTVDYTNPDFPHLRGVMVDITGRKLSEEALKQSESQLAEAQRLAHIGSWNWDLQKNVMTWSDEHYRIFGVQRGDIDVNDDDGVFDFIHPEDRELVRSVVAKSIEAKESFNFYYRIVRRDGEERIIQSSGSIETGERGQPIRMFGTAQDVTERGRIEQELRQSEERYRDLVENAHDLIYEHDLKGNYTATNKAVEQITGYSLEESLELNLAQTVAPDYQEKAQEMLRRKLAGESVTAYDLVVIAKDGRRVPVEVNTRLVFKDGVPVGVQGIARDITERKKAENRLSAQYAVTRALAESNTIDEGASKILQAICESLGWEYGSLWTVDRRSNDLRCSQVWQAPGAEADEFESVSRQSVFTPGIGLPGRVWNDGQPVWIADLAEDTNFPRFAVAARVGFHGGCAFPIRFRSEILGVLEFFSRSIREPDPDLLAMMVTIGSQVGQFIERKRVEEALGESEEQLRQSQKLEAIGQLAGGVAHDFNNLLTVIGGYSSILLGKLPQDSPHRSSIEEIKKASDRASALTRQLLAFSRKQILQPKVLDLNIVVTDLERMVRRLIGEDIDLLTITSPVLGKVKADPGQIEQVLLNLIVNARDAMPKGGKLTIETRNVVHSKEYAQRHAALPGPYVMLAVSDTGCGMDATIQPRVFEPFFTTKDSGEGTGLGLATVYGIVKQSGGNIWVYSEVGRGSTFKVYLPRVDEVAEGEEVISKSIPKGTEMVLLVEDEDQVRAILKHILEGQGYHVLAASNGEEALSISQDLERNIKLMITDVVMPQMSGRELAERVQAVRPNLPVLFMSGYTDDAIVRHGLLDEKLNFIQKPFDSTTVARKVREVLDSHR